MIYHLTHLTYNIESYPAADDSIMDHTSVITARPCPPQQFERFLSLPLELIMHISSYLDYPELINLSCANKMLRFIICVFGTHFITKLRMERVKCVMNGFIASRPTVVDLYNRRILKNRLLYVLAIQPEIWWRRLEMFELLAFMARKRQLQKLISKRPQREELVLRGILKTNVSYNAGHQQHHRHHHRISTNRISKTIENMETYKIEEILRNFIQQYYKPMVNTKTNKNEFLDKLKFFENHPKSQEDDLVVELSAKAHLKNKKKKKLLQANVIGNKVVFT